MQSISNLPAPTHDLRSTSKAYLRDSEQKAKWGTESPVRGCSHMPVADWEGINLCDKCDARPPHRGARQHGRHASHKECNAYKGVTRQKRIARRAIGNEINAVTGTDFASDTSGDESVKEALAANDPTAEVMYSFDAQHGPTHGESILGAALTKAVERFENKQTEILVREYDVVEHINDAGNEADIDEDGFELVDYATLH